MLGSSDVVSSAARSSHSDRFDVAGEGTADVLFRDLLSRSSSRRQRLGGGAVEVAALGRQHVVVHRLTYQVVTERETFAVTHDEAGERGVSQDRCDVHHAVPGNRGDVLQCECAAEEAGDPHRLVGLCREPGQAADECLVQVRRRIVGDHLDDARIDAERSVVVHGTQQLGHEQRVAAGSLQPTPQPLAGCGAREHAGQRLHVDLAERVDADTGGGGFPGTLDESVERRRARRRPERGQYAEARHSGACRDGGQHLHRQVVGPVQVLRGEQQRL